MDDLVEHTRERVRAICFGFGDVTEKLSHGEPSWFVRGRLFVTSDTYHHGSKHLGIWVNAAPGAQDVLVGANPELYFVPPYVGKQGWIGVRLDVEPESEEVWAEIAGVIADGHAVSAAKVPVKRARKAG